MANSIGASDAHGRTCASSAIRIASNAAGCATLAAAASAQPGCSLSSCDSTPGSESGIEDFDLPATHYWAQCPLPDSRALDSALCPEAVRVSPTRIRTESAFFCNLEGRDQSPCHLTKSSSFVETVAPNTPETGFASGGHSEFGARRLCVGN